MSAAGIPFEHSNLAAIAAGYQPFDDFDDSVIYGGGDGLPLEDASLFPADWDQQTPPYENLPYPAATPLSWDLAQPKIEPLPTATFSTINTLTPAQQEKLRQIAMPSHLQYRGHNSPNSTASTKSQSISSPDSNGNSRKRKSSMEAEVEAEDDDEEGSQHPPVKKTAHNMIEKRYRTNLNDKIAALRDSVPSLRIMTKSAKGEDTADDREDLQGLTPAHKLNKATVLSKATEYIKHLEKRTKRLQEENAAQKARLAAFETLFRSGSMGFNPAPITNPFQYPVDYNTPGPSPTNDPQGMIQVPENIRRLRVGVNQQIYAVPQEQYRRQVQQPNGPNGWQTGGGYLGKLMVGSLAGLMIMEGFAEPEQQDDSPNARGLFALPTQILRIVSRPFHSSTSFSFMGFHRSGAQVLVYFKTILVIAALLYVFVPSLFLYKSNSKKGKEESATVAAAPSLASPIQVRRQAWLTAIQTVWVPRHNFFLEASALLLKMLKLSMRNFVGWRGYAYITGITQQQEAARVKAWTIALDAQLAGGDVEVSMSRLTLTLLASETLPDSPARLMLKALHIRVLLWEVGNAGANGFYMFHEAAAKMARWKWNEAQALRKLMVRTSEKQDDELPEYLAVLLEQAADDVLSDVISQRAYNLAWNLPTSHNLQSQNNDMDGVVDDVAIRSPLDAIAAWYSSSILQRALAKSLHYAADDAEAQKAITDDILLAINTAPIGSAAQVRALIARAVIFKERRGFNIAAAMQAIGPLEQSDTEIQDGGHNIIQTNTSIANLPDIKMSLHCAMAIAHLDRFRAPANPEAAHRIIPSIVPVNLTLLSFAASFKLMEKIYGHQPVSISCSSSLETLAGNLRLWIGGKKGERSGLEKEAKKNMVERCLNVTKHVTGMIDAGYGSMSEEDLGEDC